MWIYKIVKYEYSYQIKYTFYPDIYTIGIYPRKNTSWFLTQPRCASYLAHAPCANYGSNSQSSPFKCFVVYVHVTMLMLPLEHIVHSIPSRIAKCEENIFACFGLLLLLLLLFWWLEVEVLCLQSILMTQSISWMSNLRKRIRIRMNLMTEKIPSLGVE